MRFWIKTNRFIKWLFPKYIWEIPNANKEVYLTFDDGPTPEITAWTLNELQKHNAQATFFCIGNNIEKHPELFKRIVESGHAIGNHTFNHLKGWKTDLNTYIENTHLCQKQFDSHNLPFVNLFRPPYGKIKNRQANALQKLGYKIIMWDIISQDYDKTVSEEMCVKNVIQHIKPGSIIVFHDSVKASQNLKYALPIVLKFLNENGFVCSKID
jgi:peptidoglycan/xylan/chitin deacetylase (PgdA/CDA1 family)